MTAIVIFSLLLLFTGLFALRRGQGPEKVVALMMTVAFVSSVAQPYRRESNFSHMFTSMLVIDTALLIGLLIVAVLANRFWPAWIAALQLITIGVHLAKRFEPVILATIYAQVSQKIGYVMVLLLAIGVIRLQGRLKVHGAEQDWSPVSR